uniref:COP9 signalosome complex subunit 3 n=1 Tax=Lotharella globosa TaxID=91324 RepID=A0A7S3ZC83_9EUKA
MWALARESNMKDLNVFTNLASGLFTEGNPNALKDEKRRVYEIAKEFAKISVMTNPKSGILPLHYAIQKICRSTPNLLTPLHTGYLLLCILSKCYDSALTHVEVTKYEIEPRSTGMKVKDYLTFHYYAGKIYCVMKKYEEALEHFQAILTAPTEAGLSAVPCISAVQVEAYKKHVLVSLIRHGKVVTLPKQVTSLPVMHKCKDVAGTAYENVRSCFTKSVEELKKKVEGDKETFVKDENWGLVKQVVSVITKQKIQKLNKTYATLSFADIVKLSNLKDEKEAESRIADMIEDGDISAVISIKDRMVTFSEPAKEDEMELAMKLKAKIQEAFLLSSKLREVDCKLQTNQVFVKKNMSLSRGKESFDQGYPGAPMTEEDQLRRVLEKSKTDQ